AGRWAISAAGMDRGSGTVREGGDDPGERSSRDARLSVVRIRACAASERVAARGGSGLLGGQIIAGGGEAGAMGAEELDHLGVARVEGDGERAGAAINIKSGERSAVEQGAGDFQMTAGHGEAE